MGILDSEIHETCRCGAKFKIIGSPTFCEYRYREFLKAHESCREKFKYGNNRSQTNQETQD